MASITMATAAGAAFLLYYSEVFPWQRRARSRNPDEILTGDERLSDQVARARRIRSQLLKPSRPPSTWTEALSMLAETLRFTYSETLGKWPIADLAFGINYLLRRQSKSNVETIYAKGSPELQGKYTLNEMKELFRLITICYAFSKRSLEGFIEETGLKKDDVLYREARAELLKPAYAIVLDHKSSHVLVIIRGTHSMKDTLTAVTGATVPFHHILVDRSGGSTVRQLVLGYAHCGMVAAARSIAKHSSPMLLEALKSNPGFKIKVIGHSLGGGTAALLTFVLREKPEFYETTCVTFASAACMTWELAESGYDCVTSLINGADVIPTFSAASADDLRSEVTASAWVNDLREQMEKMRILKMVMNSAVSLRNRLTDFSNVTYNFAGFGRGRLNGRREADMSSPPPSPISNFIWRSGSTGKIVHNVQTVANPRPNFLFNALTCMGVRRRTPYTNPLEPIEDQGYVQEEKKDLNSPKGDAMDASFIHMKMKREDSTLQSESVSKVSNSEREMLSATKESGNYLINQRKGDEENVKMDGDSNASQGDKKIDSKDSEHIAGLAVLINAMRKGKKRQKKSTRLMKRFMEFDPLNDLHPSDSDNFDSANEDEALDVGEEIEEVYSPMYRIDSERNMQNEGKKEMTYSWQELEKELHRNLHERSNRDIDEELMQEEEMVRKMCEEEEEVLSQASGMERSDGGMEELDDFVSNQKRFFPCGRILHMIKVKCEEDDPDNSNDESVSESLLATPQSERLLKEQIDMDPGKNEKLQSVKKKLFKDDDGDGDNNSERLKYMYVDTGFGLESFVIPNNSDSKSERLLKKDGTSNDAAGGDRGDPTEALKKENLDKPGEPAPPYRFGVFLTNRRLYGKVKLSRTMVLDHFMPTYKKSILEVIDQLENVEKIVDERDTSNLGEKSLETMENLKPENPNLLD